MGAGPAGGSGGSEVAPCSWFKIERSTYSLDASPVTAAANGARRAGWNTQVSTTTRAPPSAHRSDAGSVRPSLSAWFTGRPAASSARRAWLSAASEIGGISSSPSSSVSRGSGGSANVSSEM